MKRLWLLTAALIACAVPSQAQVVVRLDLPAVTGAEGELARVRAEFVVAANARDARRISNLYAPDALAILSDDEPLRGAAAIERHFGQALGSSTPPAVVTLTPHRFDLGDSTGIGAETGTFVESTAADAGAPAVTGAYVTIYSRGSDGKWRIAMEVRTTGALPPAVRW